MTNLPKRLKRAGRVKTGDALLNENFQRQGIYLTIEVDNVDEIYEEMKNKGVEIKVEIRNEFWGDRHFSIEDPNGVIVDFVKYSPPQDK